MRSFFQRENDNASPKLGLSRPVPAAAKKERPPDRETTRLARGSKVVGTISGNAELVVDGRVEGQIDLGSRVAIGGKGRVQGGIVAATVVIGGKVHGNVRGLEKVEILASGSLEGDVSSPRVVIAEGAFFKGKIEMAPSTPAAEGPPAVEHPQSKPAPPFPAASPPAPAPQTGKRPPAKKRPPATDAAAAGGGAASSSA